MWLITIQVIQYQVILRFFNLHMMCISCQCMSHHFWTRFCSKRAEDSVQKYSKPQCYVFLATFCMAIKPALLLYFITLKVTCSDMGFTCPLNMLLSRLIQAMHRQYLFLFTRPHNISYNNWLIFIFLSI